MKWPLIGRYAAQVALAFLFVDCKDQSTPLPLEPTAKNQANVSPATPADLVRQLAGARGIVPFPRSPFVRPALLQGVFIPRNAPPLFNLAAMRHLFWDGRVEVATDGTIRTPAGNKISPTMTRVFEFGAWQRSVCSR